MSSPANGFPPKLEFELNVPRILAMAYAEGKPCNSRSGDSLMWTTTAGERFFTDPYVGDRARAAGLAVGVPMEWEKIEVRQGNRRMVEFQVRPLRNGTSVPGGGAPAPIGVKAENGQHNPTPAPLPTWDEHVARQPAPPAPVNGAGDTGAAILARCYHEAIDVALAAVAYAESKGLRITPAFEDVRAMAATLCIGQQARR